MRYGSSGRLWLHFINSFNRWCLCPEHFFFTSFQFFIEILSFSYIFMLNESEKAMKTKPSKTLFDIWFHTIILQMVNWLKAKWKLMPIFLPSFLKIFVCFHLLSLFASLCYSCWHLLWDCIGWQNNNIIRESFCFTRSIVDNRKKAFGVLTTWNNRGKRKIEYAKLCVLKAICSWCSSICRLFRTICYFYLVFIVCIIYIFFWFAFSARVRVRVRSQWFWLTVELHVGIFIVLNLFIGSSKV